MTTLLEDAELALKLLGPLVGSELRGYYEAENYYGSQEDVATFLPEDASDMGILLPQQILDYLPDYANDLETWSVFGESAARTLKAQAALRAKTENAN